MHEKYCFDATYLIEIPRDVFLSQTEVTLSSLGLFCFVFFTKDFLLLLICPRAKLFSRSKELPQVNFVKGALKTRYADSMKNEPQDERSPRGFA